MKKKILGLEKNVFFLGLTSLFNDFSSEMIFSIFPAFFVSVLHVGARSLGLVDGFAEAASNLFKIYSGSLSDKIQKRKFLVVSGYTLSVITRPFYILVSSVGGVFGLRFVDRIGKGLRDSPRDAIISLSVPKEELGKSFGYHRTMDTTGAILGPLFAYLILRFFPMRFDYVFITAFAVGIIAVLTLIFISDVVAVSSSRKIFIGAWGNLSSQFKFFLLSIFILSIGSLPVAIVLLKTTSIGLLIADIPLFYMIYSISYAVFSLPAGKLSDIIGTRVVLFIGYTLLLLSYFVLNKSSGLSMLVIGFLIFGLFPAFTDGVGRSLASKLTNENSRGGGLGWLNAAIGFGALFSGVFGGYIWQVYGSETAFITGAIIIFIGLIIFILSSFKK